MGIRDLVASVRPYFRTIPLKDLRGKTLGIDMSVWAYKGQATGMGMGYTYRMLHLLRQYGIKFILVFDGNVPDAKKKTIQKRHGTQTSSQELEDESKESLDESLEDEFDDTLEETFIESFYESMEESIEEPMEESMEESMEEAIVESMEEAIVESMEEAIVEPSIDLPRDPPNDLRAGAGHVMRTVKSYCLEHNITFVQGPLEADHQLMRLWNEGTIDYIVSIDGDFIALGCTRIIFRFNKGGAEVFEQQDFERSWINPYNLDALRAVCILLGGDYFPGGLPGFGIVKAKELYNKLKGRPVNYEQMLEILPPFANATEKKEFTRCYMIAHNTMKYELVLDVKNDRVVPLHDYPPGKSAADYPYAGRLEECDAAMDFFNPSSQPYLPATDETLEEMYAKLADKRKIIFHCPDCGELFTESYELQKHQYKVHPYLCRVCNVKCRSPRELKDHAKLHVPNPVKAYFCDVCPKGFVTWEQLRCHKKTHKPKTLVCPVCEKVFGVSSVLRDHMTTHSKEKPFICEICNKGFRLSYQLKQHERIHLEVKPFVCSTCGRGFSQKKQLKFHERHHTEKVPFPCAKCGKGFSTPNNLTTHKKTCKGVARKEWNKGLSLAG